MTKSKLIPVGYPELIEPGMLFIAEARFQADLHRTELININDPNERMLAPDGYYIPFLNSLAGQITVWPGMTFLVLDILTPIIAEDFICGKIPPRAEDTTRWVALKVLIDERIATLSPGTIAFLARNIG